MEPHRESTDGSNTSPASTLLSSYSQVFLVFFLQVQIPCYILSSCAMSQVRRAVSLSVVPVQHCCFEKTRRGQPSRFLGLFFVWWTPYRSFQLVTRKGKRTKQWNEDKFIILRRRMISMQPCSWTNIRARRSTSARSDLLVKKNNFDKWTSCLPACLCMRRYLCLEPDLPVAMRFHASCSAVTSALASPVAYLHKAGLGYCLALCVHSDV